MAGYSLSRSPVKSLLLEVEEYIAVHVREVFNACLIKFQHNEKTGGFPLLFINIT